MMRIALILVIISLLMFGVLISLFGIANAVIEYLEDKENDDND